MYFDVCTVLAHAAGEVAPAPQAQEPGPRRSGRATASKNSSFFCRRGVFAVHGKECVLWTASLLAVYRHGESRTVTSAKQTQQTPENALLSFLAKTRWSTAARTTYVAAPYICCSCRNGTPVVLPSKKHLV